MHMARRSYVHALLKTNAALADPFTATDEFTLISVLLLSLFEAVAWSESRTPDSWTTHTRGALMLLKLRGQSQFKTSVGQQLFIQVANIILVNSLQTKMRLPEELLELIAIALEYQSECPKYRLTCLTAEVAALVSDIHQGVLNAEETIDALMVLQVQYIAYADSLVYPWRYQEIVVDVSRPEVYGNTVHQYASHRAAGLWNSYRMTRMLLNEIIHAYSAYMPSDLANVLQTRAVDSIEEMTTEICASIPQFANPAEFALDLDPLFPCSQHPSSGPPVTSMSSTRSAASVMWPLSVILGADLANVEVRAYAVERLEYLGRVFRMPQTERGDGGEMSSLQDGLHMYYFS
jgi:hypothetical protein